MEQKTEIPVVAVKPLQQNQQDVIHRILRNPRMVKELTIKLHDPPSNSHAEKRKRDNSGGNNWKRKAQGENLINDGASSTSGSSTSGGGSSSSTSGGSSSSTSQGGGKQSKPMREKAPVFCPLCGKANPRTAEQCCECGIKMWDHLPSACRKCLKDIFEGNMYCHRCGTRAVEPQQMETEENSNNNNSDPFKIPPPPKH